MDVSYVELFGQTLSIKDTTARQSIADIDNELKFIEFSVKQFGAVGDGITDDTEAFRNCFSRAEAVNGCVYIPYGNYLITDTLIVNTARGITIKGQRAADTRDENKCSNILFKPASKRALFKIGDNTKYIYHCFFNDIKITIKSDTSNAFEIQGLQESTFYNVQVWAENNLCEAAFYVWSCSLTNFVNCVISKTVKGFDFSQYAENVHGSGNWGVNITMCNIYATKTAFHGNYIVSTRFYNNWVEGFNNAFLLENSAGPVEVHRLDVYQNDFIVSSPGENGLLLNALQNGSFFVNARFENNYVYRNPDADPGVYAVSVPNFTPPSTIVFKDNQFDGYSGGISDNVNINYIDNYCRTALYGDFLQSPEMCNRFSFGIPGAYGNGVVFSFNAPKQAIGRSEFIFYCSGTEKINFTLPDLILEFIPHGFVCVVVSENKVTAISGDESTEKEYSNTGLSYLPITVGNLGSSERVFSSVEVRF